MPHDLAAFLDELGSYVEQSIHRLPPSLARALTRPDTVLPMQTLLRILECPQTAERHLLCLPGFDAKGNEPSAPIPSVSATAAASN